MLCEA